MTFTNAETDKIMEAKAQLEQFINTRIGFGWSSAMHEGLIVMTKIQCIMNLKYPSTIWLHMLRADDFSAYHKFLHLDGPGSQNAIEDWKAAFDRNDNGFSHFSLFPQSSEERNVFIMDYNFAVYQLPPTTYLKEPLLSLKKVVVFGTRYKTREELMQHRYMKHEQLSYTAGKLYINRDTFDSINRSV